jgi:solute carrier family 25 (mitochondrial phosphate transporter), member 23/24/25/41
MMFQIADMPKSGVPSHYGRHVWPALKSMYAREGVAGLWRGNFTHMAKKGPFAAIKFLSYERYKQLITRKGVPSGRQRMVAGGLAALTAATITYPLDLVQARVTVLLSEAEYRGRSTIWGVLRSTVRQEGVLGLYRGMSVALLSVVPYMAMNLSLWEVFKQKLAPSGTTEPSPLISAAAGGMSSAVASTVTFPLDLLRRRMQVSGSMGGNGSGIGNHSGYLAMIGQIWRTQGVLGFYRGCWPHYITVVPAVAISMGTYDLLKIGLKIT